MQNWIDDRPAVRPACRSGTLPEPPRFSDAPAQTSAQRYPRNISLGASAELGDALMSGSPDGRAPLPESEEKEIKQVRSRNKAVRVLDSQTADLYDRQPDDDAPQQACPEHAAQGKERADGGQRCASGKQHGAPAKRQHGVLGKDPTAISKLDSLHVPAKCRGERATGIRLPSPPVEMPTTIPCVFVSSQQGSRSCAREQPGGAQPVERSGVRNTCAPAAVPQHPRAASPSHVGGKSPGLTAAKRRVERSTSAPNASTVCGSATPGSDPSDSAKGSMTRRQSAPVGADWQLRRSRTMITAANTAAGHPAVPSCKKQPVATGTPGRRNRDPACQFLSPGGGVRRSARIAAHNIAPAADGDRAFGAIGALSQCFSPGFAGAPVTPTRASVEPSRRGIQGATLLFAQLYSECTTYTESDTWPSPCCDVNHQLEVAGCPAAGTRSDT